MPEEQNRLVTESEPVAAQRFRVAGMPGVFIVVVTIPRGEAPALVRTWAEFEGKAAGVERLGLPG